jgi:hypothetical protein
MITLNMIICIFIRKIICFLMVVWNSHDFAYFHTLG